ncbi:helix-turn-helix domain-containing protein [Pelagibacterium luteolum]|uniref:Transcriptional regulator, XRE family with cupin sensor n=1 Tax=Pelagibacterium luteolum TaxID=440168 RepID=A0A1G7TVX9_9HYPH|nr:XRE family transcriptional regulator [Pelagibacterium luteolum]SDG39291.1 transcriptional regulator, XRE family with cupin sensor [Pelagibacterium luteolum]
MSEITPPQIGPVIQKARKARHLTLEQLAKLSGVSRSMLSQIERSETNPTFAVVWSLTQALNIEFSDLVSGDAVARKSAMLDVVPADHVPFIASLDGMCRLKILSPPALAGKTEWYLVEIEPGGALTSAPHAARTREHFTALTDGLAITAGDTTTALTTGEVARYAADVPHAIANTSDTIASGWLVVLFS